MVARPRAAPRRRTPTPPPLSLPSRRDDHGRRRGDGGDDRGRRRDGEEPSRRPKAEAATAPPLAVVTTFEAMGLSEPILRGVYAFGFEAPSAIQARAVAPILAGRDVIAQAQSGTGKTSMIALAAAAMTNPSIRDAQTLILSPTRELAAQTERACAALGEHASVRTWCAVGGASVGRDVRECEAGKHVVSGTPGRVFDLISRGALSVKKIKTLVLDEADELLESGFKEQIYDVYRHLPADVQVVLVSATLPPAVVALADKFTSRPVRILVQRDALSLEGIRQFYVAVEVGAGGGEGGGAGLAARRRRGALRPASLPPPQKEDWKFDTLCDLYDSLTVTQAVIFCNSRKKVDWLTAQLRAANFTVSAMHGDMPQRERDGVTAEFRGGATRVLITTDVWARGLDVAQARGRAEGAARAGPPLPPRPRPPPSSFFPAGLPRRQLRPAHAEGVLPAPHRAVGPLWPPWRRDFVCARRGRGRAGRLGALLRHQDRRAAAKRGGFAVTREG